MRHWRNYYESVVRKYYLYYYYNFFFFQYVFITIWNNVFLLLLIVSRLYIDASITLLLLHWLAICIASSVAFSKASSEQNTEFIEHISIMCHFVRLFPHSQSTVLALDSYLCKIFFIRSTLNNSLNSWSNS